MKYWKVEISNGYCGFDDNFLFESRYKPSPEELFQLYDYAEGGGGLDPYDGEEFDTYDDYVDEVLENIWCVEITQEEANQLEEEGWEYKF